MIFPLLGVSATENDPSVPFYVPTGTDRAFVQNLVSIEFAKPQRSNKFLALNLAARRPWVI